jgi:hypothetical protein
MALRTVAAALASLALIPAVAEASTKPKFPRTVTGTISGTHLAKQPGDPQVFNQKWTIKGVRFTLEHVRFVENTWTGFYKVTAGTVTFSETESGPCTYSLEKTFALRPAMPKRPISTPFFLERDMLGRDSYGGNVSPTIHWTTTETCTDPDGGEPRTDAVRVDPDNLFDSRSPRSFRIGRAMKGTYKYRDGEYGNLSYSWSLKPRR